MKDSITTNEIILQRERKITHHKKLLDIYLHKTQGQRNIINEEEEFLECFKRCIK